MTQAAVAELERSQSQEAIKTSATVLLGWYDRIHDQNDPLGIVTDLASSTEKVKHERLQNFVTQGSR